MISEHKSGSLERKNYNDEYRRTLRNLCKYTDNLKNQLHGLNRKEKIRRLNILIDIGSKVDHDTVSLKTLHKCEQILFPSIALLESLSNDEDISEKDTVCKVLCT